MDLEELPKQSLLGNSEAKERYDIEGGKEGSVEGGEEYKSDEEGDGDKKREGSRKFQVEMSIVNPADLTGDFVVKSLMGKFFNDFRNIMRKKQLKDHFRYNCFGYFLDLPADNNARFQLSMAYDLLKSIVRGGVGGDGVASRVVDVGVSHADKHVADAQEKINMSKTKFNLLEDDDFQITPFSGPTHPSSSSCYLCKCKKCMDKHDTLFKRIDDLINTVKELTSKTGVKPSNKLRETYTPAV
ncbi:hypothetical protein FXO38_14527 [Capsicum annuum]|nr:hypothetical protein FXO38_14527 [Capsicum annuum]